MTIAFALLSSMLIVSTGQTSLAPVDGTDTGGVLRQNLVKEAIVWMDSQMPGYLFHRDLEKYISAAAQLRYEGQGEGPHYIGHDAILELHHALKVFSRSSRRGKNWWVQGSKGTTAHASQNLKTQTCVL